jgi:predicted DNA-binding antitoxin AbrB/MazE fold protein
MKHKLAEENPKAKDVLPENKPDGSGVGVNYADAYIKPLKKVLLEDGTKVICKRRGLKLTMKVGKKSGEGLLRRLEHGPDAHTMLQHALQEAAKNAGAAFSVEDGVMYLEL